MSLRLACCFGAAFALSVNLFAQGSRPSGPSPGAPPTNPGANIPNPGRTNNPNPGNLPQQGPFPGQAPMQRPIFLSGKVMMDDGTPPPEPVPIQRICTVNPHTEGYTDSKGRFSFQLGQPVGVVPDASEQNIDGRPGMGPTGSMGGPGMMQGTQGGPSMGRMGSMPGDASMMLMGCTLRASLAGYRSDAINLTNHRSLDNPDVGVIILHRIANVEGQTISATTALAPKDARKAFDKAANDLKKQKWDDAQKELQKATDIYPRFAAAWYELGVLQERNHDVEAAKKSYAQALAADSKYLKPYRQLAGIAMREQKWQEAKDATARLVSLDPIDFPDAWYYNAVANYELKNYDAAEKSAREGVKADTDHVVPRTNQLLAVLLAGKGDLPGAAASLQNYLKVAPNGPEAETVKKQLAAVEQKIQAAAPAQQPKP